MTIDTAAILKLVDEFTGPSEKVLGANLRLDKSLRDTQKHLNGLKTNQADIQSFTKLQAQSANTKEALDKQQIAVAKLAKEFRDAERPVNKLGIEFDQAKRRSNELKAQSDKTATAFEIQEKSVAALAQEIKNAARPTDRLSGELENAKRRAGELKVESDGVRGSLEKQELSVSTLAKKFKDAQRPVEKLGLEFDEAKRRSNELKAQSDKTATALETQEKSVAALAKEIKAATRPTERLNREFEQAKRRAGELKVESDGVRRSLEKQELSVSTLAKKFKDAQRPVEKLGLEFDQAKRLSNELKAQSNKTATALETQEKSVAALANEIKSAARPTERLNREFEQAKRRAGELKVESDGVRHSLEKQELSVSTLAKKFKDAQRPVEKLGLEFDQAKRLSNELKAQSTKTTTALERQEKSVAALANEIKSAARPTKRLNREFEQAKRRAGELKVESDGVRRSLEKQELSVSTLAKKFKDAQRPVEKLGFEFDQAKRLSNELKAQSNKTATALETQEKSVAALANEIKSTARPTERLSREFEQAKRRASELKAESNQARIAFDKQKVGVSKLSKEFQKAKGPTKKLNREFEQAKRRAGELKVAHSAETQQLERLKRRVEGAGFSVDKLGRYEQKLNRDVEKATRGIKEQQRALVKHNQTMQKTQRLADNAKGIAGKGAVAGGTGLAGLWVAKRGLDGLGEYKSLLADIAVNANLTDEQIKHLKETISTSSDLSLIPRKLIGEGAQVLVAAGLNFDDTLNALPGISRAATAANAEVEDISRTAFSVINNLDIQSKNLERTLNMLAAAGKNGGFELDNMAKYFPGLTAQAKRLGLVGVEGVASLGAALQVARDGAGDEAEAANNLKNFLAKATSPETVKRAADTFGIDLERELKAATARGLNPLEFMVNRIQQLTGGDAFRVGELFGDLQVQQFLTPMLDNLDEYKRIKNEVLNSNGVVDQDLSRRVELDPTKQWAKLGDDFRELKDEIFTPLLPVLRELSADLKPIVKGIGNWVKEHPTLTKWIVGSTVAMFGLLAVLGPLISLVASGVTIWAMWGLRMAAVGGSAGLFTGMLKGLGTAAMFLARTVLPAVIKGVVLLGRALLFNPIGLAITAIGLGAYFIIKHWTPIAAFFSRIWSGVKGGVSSFVSWFAKFTPFGLLIDGANMVENIFSGGFSGIWDSLKSDASEMFNWLTKYSPISVLTRGAAELKKLVFDFFGKGDSKVEVEATKVVRNLPVRSSQLAQRNNVARISKPVAKDEAFDANVRSRKRFVPLTPSTNKTIVEKNEFHASYTINPSQGMDEQKIADLIDEKNRQLAAQSGRRRRGLLHGE